MARIQILELPSQHLGTASKTPFAVIIDQVESEQLSTSTGVKFTSITEISQADADAIARKLGAVGGVVYAGTLDLA